MHSIFNVTERMNRFMFNHIKKRIASHAQFSYKSYCLHDNHRWEMIDDWEIIDEATLHNNPKRVNHIQIIK